jgi:L-cysteine:1D-myo-inositol 2-amino-2-deoxy-alpha-D-glucopyranoside ligase
VKLYNSLTQHVDFFEPAGDPATIYLCGITPYDTTHLGHAFTDTSVDILIRYLEYCGHNVLYVQNITDIDDDILRKAREVGADWQELGNTWTRHFIQDMQALNVRPPDFYPRATDVISEIIDLVQKLLEHGVAYERNGNVYFNIDAWPRFGELSRLPRRDMLPVANECGNHPDDPNKMDPLDFVLWQAKATDEPAWDSPWGPGRPGWHIECSTMSTKFLGETIDLHSGGGDLKFPHHECEIAQVEPVTGRHPFVRFWVHAAMVHHDGAKMSKSLGNLVMVRDLLNTYSPDGLRLYLGRHHYRDIWSYSESELDESERWAYQIKKAVLASSRTGKLVNISSYRDRFNQALSNDLDTPQAVQVLLELSTEIISGEGKSSDIKEAQAEIRVMGKVLGLQLDQEPDARTIEGWEKHLVRFV